MAARYWFLGCVAALAFACGNNGGSNNDAGGGGDDGGGGGGDGDGGVAGPDAPPFGGTCTMVVGAPQCSDCVDNDADTRIDGFDPECSGPADRLEDSFETGIPGDNIDATMQDCFFDGNSGAGNDGCNQHVCCLLQASSEEQCGLLAPDADASKFDITKCYQPFGDVPVPQKCVDNCGVLVSTGCDCFGCCTICDAGGCRAVIVNPSVSPLCTDMNISDPGPDGLDPDTNGDGLGDGTGDEPCKRCLKTTCGQSECGGATCVLCPGQTALPPECIGGTPTCPSGIIACDAANGNACAFGTYCSAGCCIGSFL
jgi:hypothetical protein